MRKLTGAISRTNTTCIFINQLREKIGSMFGPMETTTGGNALKFYASVRIDIRSEGMLGVDNGSYATGFLCLRYGMDGKSCLAAGFGTVDFDDSSTGIATHSERVVQSDGAGWNHVRKSARCRYTVR